MIQPNPDKRKILYDAVSKQYDLGTYDEFTKKLEDPTKRQAFYNGVGKEFDLGSYQEFEQKVGVKKKDNSVSSAPKQPSASASGSGSSGQRQFRLVNDTDKGAEAGIKVNGKTYSATGSGPGKKAPATEVYDFTTNVSPDVETLQQQDIANRTQGLRNSPEYTQLYTDFKNASNVSDEKREQIRQEVENDAAESGLWNKTKRFARSWWNGVFSEDDALQVSEPLADEKKEARKELEKEAAEAKSKKQQPPVIDNDAITARAKEIKFNKRVKSESESQVRSFLKDAEDVQTFGFGDNNREVLRQYNEGAAATLSLKDKENRQKIELLRPALETSASEIKELNAEVQGYVNSGLEIPMELRQAYQDKYAQYESVLKDVLDTQDDYVNNREELGNATANLDILKRDYSWSKNFLNNIASTGADLTAGLAGSLGYINELLAPESRREEMRRATLDATLPIQRRAQQLRDQVMKPIAVDDINGAEDFGSWLSNTVIAQQLPILTLISTGAPGIAALGASETGTKYTEMLGEIERGKEYSRGQLAGIPIAFGATETLSAMVDYYLLKGAGRVIRSATEPERRLIAKGFAESLLQGTKQAGKQILKGAAYEGVDESLTQLSQNMIDIYAGDKTEIGIWDNVKDAAAAGAAMGVLLPAAGYGASGLINLAVKPFETTDTIEKAAANIERLENLLGNPELSETARGLLEEQLLSAEGRQISEIEKVVGNVANMSDEDFNEVVRISREQVRIKQTAKEINSDSTIDDDTRKMLLDNLDKDYEAARQRRIEVLGRSNGNDTNVDTTEESNNAQPETTNETGTSQDAAEEIPNSGQTKENQISAIEDRRKEELYNISIDETVASDEKLNQINEVNARYDKELSELESNVAPKDPRIKEITDKLDSLYATLTKNGMSQAEAESAAINSLSREERDILTGRSTNTQANEGTQGQNTPADGNDGAGIAELGNSEAGGQQANVGEQQDVQPTADTGTGEAAVEVTQPAFETPRQALDATFDSVEEQLYPEGVKRAGETEYTAKKGDFVLSVKPSATGYDVFLGRPGKDVGGVETFGEIQSWFPANDSELIDVINEASVIMNPSTETNETVNIEAPPIEVSAETTPAAETTETEKGFERKPEKKSVVNRLYEGDTSDTIKGVAEKLGLNYEVENQEQAQKAAKAFVDEVGITGALEAARTGVVKGAEKAFVYAEVLDKITEAVDKAEPNQRAKIEEQYMTVLSEATEMFDQEARDSGRFISALNRVYNTSKIKYALSRQIERYKAANNGEIDEVTLAKFKEADAKIKELEEKIKEAEQRAEAAEQKAAMDNIVEATKRKPRDTTKQRAKKVANEIRKLKITKPGAFNAATAGIVWDGAIEVVAKTIETGGTVAEGISKAVAYIKRTKWYKDLSEDKKNEALTQFSNSVNESQNDTGEKVTVEDGVIYIPEPVIRSLVEGGIDNINDLSQAVLDMISVENPDITLRDIRDAITKYGRTINPTQDAIQKEINLMKRLGRLISGLEDVDNGERPLRSGLQREKPTQEERRMQRELREKMKDLPLDHADLEKQWKTALDATKSRLQNQIEDLEKQIEAGEKRSPEKTPLQYDEEANALREKRDNLRTILDEMVGKPELTNEQKLQRAINATERSVEKLRKQIESGDIGFNPTPQTLSSPELNALKETRKQLSDELNEMRKQAGIVEQRKLQQAKDRVNNRIAELQKKIRDRDYSKRKPQPIKADDELLNLQAEKVRWQEVYDRAAYQAELKNRPLKEKAREAIVGALNIFRILKATGELSPVLIQGGVQTVNLAVRKPKTLLRAFARLFVSLGSARRAEQFDALMKSNSNYGVMKAAKLALVEPDYKLELREEQFIGNYINNLWNALGKGLEYASGKVLGVTETMPLGDRVLSFFKDEYRSMPKTRISEQFKNINPLLALERGLTVYMNELRMERFNDGLTMLEMEGKNITDNKKDFEKVAAAVNTLTGRANIGRLANIADILGTVFFSFRNTVSIMNQINPYWYATLKSNSDPWYKPSVAQKIAVYDMIRFITITTSMMYLLKAAAGDDEEGNPNIDIETDPRSSDFMKMRQGNIRFDAFHGMIPMVVFFTRQFTGETKTKGEVKELGSGRFTPTRSDLVINLGANKLSPQAGIAWRYANTKVNKAGERTNKFGQPYDLADELSLTPIYIESLNEIAKEDPDAYGKFLTFMGLFGVNSQVYETKSKEKK